MNFIESDPVDRMVIERMTGALAHRGPDDAGYFVEGRVGLEHRRLSIIDLSARYLDRDGTARLVQEHEQGRTDRSREIWTLLVFEFWHRHFIENHPRRADAQVPSPLLEVQQVC